MIHPTLKKIYNELQLWCESNSIMFDLVCDETDLQGIMLFKKNLQAVGNLLEHLNPVISEGNIHVEAKKVRGGTLLAFSLEAISESRLNEIIAEAGEELEPMSFIDKINFAFEKPPIHEETLPGDIPAIAGTCPHCHSDDKPDPIYNRCPNCSGYHHVEDDDVREEGQTSPSVENFLRSAKNFVEGQYETPERGMDRGKLKDDELNDQRAISGNGRAAVGTNSGGAVGKSQGSKGIFARRVPLLKDVAKGAKLRYEERISKIFKVNTTKSNSREFNYALHEALNGIATETGAQPNDLFKQFARALRVLGQRMGLGPLQDRLKAQGISWKQSDDGQAVILTIKNAVTKADQPIARISYETLQNPSDFETQLKNMLDFATGDAPGAFEQKEQEIADRKKAIGDIARAVQPQDQEGEVAQQMNIGMNPEQAAAQTAAMPKQGQPVMRQPM